MVAVNHMNHDVAEVNGSDPPMLLGSILYEKEPGYEARVPLRGQHCCMGTLQLLLNNLFCFKLKFLSIQGKHLFLLNKTYRYQIALQLSMYVTFNNPGATELARMPLGRSAHHNVMTAVDASSIPVSVKDKSVLFFSLLLNIAVGFSFCFS